jgi:DHA2 family multidrug resistance protein
VNNPDYMSAVANLHATLGGGLDQAAALFEYLLNAQAAMLGLNDIFWLSSMIFIVIIPLVWLTKPGKGGGGAAGAH